MQARNQKANWLQSICGIFLHAVHAPQKLVDSLAHMGVSTAQSTIHNSLSSLGKHILDDGQEVAQTLEAAYVYDNLEISLKPAVPTVEKAAEPTLQHFTSSMIFPFPPEIKVKAFHLQCSNFLWKQARLNARIPRSQLPPGPTWLELMTIHPQTYAINENAMTPRDRFNAWKFLHDLCHYGPESFQKYRGKIGLPEIIEQIPISKTPTVPLRATTDNNSEVVGNIRAINHMLSHVGVGDPQASLEDSGGSKASVSIANHVVLVYGDLGTGEKISSAILRRSDEDTPWARLQHVIFVMGLFHLKMACVDALWKVFIQPRSAREDDTCLMKDVSILRPTETGTVTSKPGFRRCNAITL